jgi:hypothetical protein
MRIALARILVAALSLAVGPAAAVLAQPQPGPQIEVDWGAVLAPPAQQLADHRRINAAIHSLKPQRKGVVDAYVIVVALDADPVFNREAREAGRVLSRRFGADGRTIVLAADEGQANGSAPGSINHLAIALAATAEVMDRNEDVLVLYSTSHGHPRGGLVFKDASRGIGGLPPAKLAELIDPPGFKNRLLIIQACYSGQFVAPLSSDRTIIATASSADRPSFGCSAGNDWTLYGHALINMAMRQPQPLEAQFRRAVEIVAQAEREAGLQPSNPQLSIGKATSGWLKALEARAPKTATKPVGEPPADVAELGRAQ